MRLVPAYISAAGCLSMDRHADHDLRKRSVVDCSVTQTFRMRTLPHLDFLFQD
jgi:hypothetical protein